MQADKKMIPSVYNRRPGGNFSPGLLRKNLKYIRARRGLTQEEVAQRVGTSRSTIQRIEDGRTKNPNLKIVINMCLFLRISPTVFILTDMTRLKRKEVIK